jgi:hypothetical protein
MGRATLDRTAHQSAYPHRPLADSGNVLCRRAFLTLDDVKLNQRAFAERLEAFALNGGVVDEAILATVLRRDKAKALTVVEPLHCSFGTHYCSLVFCGRGVRVMPYQPTTLSRKNAPALGCHANMRGVIPQIQKGNPIVARFPLDIRIIFGPETNARFLVC